MSLSYAMIGTALVPRLWADPLGPMLKIWPIIMLNLDAMAIRQDR
ncbi:DoxX-like family protein [Bradyrhizobium sp. USDA 372]